MTDSKDGSVNPRDDEQYRDKLTPMQFEVTRNKATERAFTGKYWDTTDKGVYRCLCCDAELFSSEAKFDSMCGWPSFYEDWKKKAGKNNSYYLGKSQEEYG